MSSSAIPPAPPPVPVSAKTAAAAVLTVIGGGETLAKLPMGSLITASMQAAEAKAVIQVLTSSGAILELKLPPNLQLPADAELTLQLVQLGGLPALKLLAINGRLFPAGNPLTGGALPPPGAADLLMPGLGGPTVGRGAAVTLDPAAQPPQAAGIPAGGAPGGGAPLGLMATVVRSAPAGAVMIPQGLGPDGQPQGPQTPPPGFSDLPTGTQLTVRIAGIAPPGGAPAPPLETAPPLPPRSPAGLPAPPTAPAQAAAPPPPAAATAPALPTATPAAGLPPATPPTVALTGNVIAHSPGGNSLVQTQAGLLSLSAGPPMPVGGTVQLEVVGAPVPPPAPTAGPLPQGLGPNGWPTLSSAADVLAQADRQAAEQLIRMIPQANPRLAAAMSVFAGAVRSGDFKQLAGDGVIKGLDKAGRRDLADRLKRDFLDLTEDAQRPRGNGDWQAITLPFAHGADIDPIRLYVHRPPPDEDGEGGNSSQEQRFILEVSMSRLGRIQFDGLIQRENNRFDLIVRSAEPLGAEICHDIAGIFAECGQLTGIKGVVGFQSGRSFVELPPCDAKGTRIMV
ncbi:MAG: DNA polymerase III [Phaeospirillum sp.]|nr:DNA polymerase III [Phaeospirillum sp.]